MFFADLHIHSKYSRACSRDSDLEHLAWWAARKGISVVGTGDFCHPVWRQELHEKLVPAEPGLFRLLPEIEDRVTRTLPPRCRSSVRFLLSVEISTIYKRDERTRKVHHLIYAPSLAAADTIAASLGRIGNLASDGRPILGLDSRDLLEITLAGGPGSYLVPAHIWTPWFAALGSKSGFDRIADCYADLADHIFAVETGLSSDPPMNWRVASLDSYTLVSNSDAHSPPALGREATLFDTELDYHAIRRALDGGPGFGGTVEFFPEEGKYHLDGHRTCGVRSDPATTQRGDDRCPVCGKPLTIGVVNRVDTLADRPPGHRPDGAAGFRSLVPLPEIVSEILGVGPKSKKVGRRVDELVAGLGPELSVLLDTDVEQVHRIGGTLLGEAITRLRRGAVSREAGFDGEYGSIRLFTPDELHRSRAVPALFDVTAPPAPHAPSGRTEDDFDEALFAELGPPRPGAALGVPAEPAPPEPPAEPPRPAEPAVPWVPGQLAIDDVPADVPEAPPAGLDAEQSAAVRLPHGPLLIIAGPGTGKTRTLTHRIIADVRRGVPPAACLAITFTRRAAAELRERLDALLPAAGRATVTTFHGLGVRILRERHDRLGLSPDFRVAGEDQRLAVAGELAGTPRDGRRMLAAIDAGTDPRLSERFAAALHARDLVDFDDLLRQPVRLLREDPALLARLRERWSRISVDEYQDVDETQYELLRLLAGDGSGLTAIGDPDQAIYAFRGADVRFFLRFAEDFDDATVLRLGRNYRSSGTIVRAAAQAVAPDTLVAGRELRSVRDDLPDVPVGVYAGADEAAEAGFIRDTIDRLLGGSSFHSRDSGRVTADGHGGLSFCDIAVLYRTDAQSRAIVAALDRAGIPVQKRSHDRLMARPWVEEIARELRYPGSGPLTDRIRDAGDAVAGRLAATGEDTGTVATAVALLKPLAERCGDDPGRLLDELALGAEVDAYDPRAQTVALLTLHAAKGLEFPVVFLAGCEQGLLPFRRPGGPAPDAAARAEERRLLFVGMTRARERLFLSYARRRTRHARPADTGASPFLSAIAPELLDRPEPVSGTARPRARQLRLL